jgi:CubicO group peptidase (beta-lactamase class C family)
MLVTAGCASDKPAADDAADAGGPTVILDPTAVRDAEPALDGVVERVMEATGIPGVAVGVVLGDEVVITRGYGVREAFTDELVDAETVFQVASLSKPIGATAVAGVVGRGDLA